jgi:hypothetical protein
LFGIWDFGFGILDFLLLGILELWYFGILSIKKTIDLQPTTKLTANDKGNQ